MARPGSHPGIHPCCNIVRPPVLNGEALVAKQPQEPKPKAKAAARSPAPDVTAPATDDAAVDPEAGDFSVGPQAEPHTGDMSPEVTAPFTESGDSSPPSHLGETTGPTEIAQS